MTMIAYAFLQSRRLAQAKREKKNPRTAPSAELAGGPAGHPARPRAAPALALPARRNELRSRDAWPLNVHYAGPLPALIERLQTDLARLDSGR